MLRKKVLAAALAAALAFTGAAAGFAGSNVSAEAAAKKTVQTVTKQSNDKGDTIKYTYNKKGLVKKSVEKSTVNEELKDTTTTTTTKYTYNKKNKIKTAVTTVVEAVTRYEKDSSHTDYDINTDDYIETRGDKIGTITTTTTTTEKYTYNKKGLATKSVATTVVTKSGSETTSYQNNRAISGTELSDGRIIAGYNSYDANGNEVKKANSSSAYYYTGDVNKARSSGTITTTYTKNSDGTYTETEEDKTTSSNYTTTYNVTDHTSIKVATYDEDYNRTTASVDSLEGYYYVSSYYVSGYDEEDDPIYTPIYAAVSCVAGNSTYDTKSPYYYYDYNDDYYYYDYNYDDDDSFALYKKDGDTYTYVGYAYITTYRHINYINVSVTDAASEGTTGTVTTTNVITDKTETTTAYKYNKKKQVKSAVVTTVDTDNDHGTVTNESTEITKGETYTETEYTKNVNETNTESTSTSVRNEKYTYKSGKLSKLVETSDGVENSVTVVSSGKGSQESKTTEDYTDKTKYPNNYEYTYSSEVPEYTETETTTVANGTRTVVNAKNGYTESYSSSHTDTDGDWSKRSGNKTVTVYANGYKVADAYSEASKYTGSYYSVEREKSGTVTTYYDKDDKVIGYVDKYTLDKGSQSDTYDDSVFSWSHKGTNYYYEDDTDGRYYYSVYSGSDTYGDMTYEYDAGNPYKYGYGYDDLGNFVGNTGDKAKTLLESAAASIEASGAGYSESKSYTVTAKPSKATTTYKYDKNGNLKSAKVVASDTDVAYQTNTTFGNIIYAYDADGEAQEVEVAVTNNSTEKYTYSNTVKKNSKRLKKSLEKLKKTYNNAKFSGLTGQKTYTVKAKKVKKSLAKTVELQQWLIQNGVYGAKGTIGLYK